MSTRYDILWMVEMGNIHFITFAEDREDAKRKAHQWMGGDKEHYTVSPLTEPGDRIHMALSLSL